MRHWAGRWPGRSLEEYRGGTVLLLDCLPENTGVRARVEAAEAALIRGGATVLRWSETGEEELARLDEAGSLAQVVALEAGTTERAAEIKERSGSGAALYGVGVTGRIAAWLERGTISAVAPGANTPRAIWRSSRRWERPAKRPSR